MNILGVDIGTSGCKTIIIDEKGSILGTSTREYPLYNPRPGWVQQNPEDWWEAVKISINEVMNENNIPSNSISGIGLSGQMHGLVVLDDKKEVIRPAILWNDQRSSSQCEKIHSLVGGAENLIEYTNNTMLAGYTGSKILWLKENEPENYKQTDYILNPKDYIRYKLTNDFATDVSDASGTGLFDVKNRHWNKKILSLLDIPLDLLPNCYESIEITGVISEKAVQNLNLKNNIPVVAGGGDAVIQTTGTAGLIHEGILGTVIGSSGIVALGLDEFRFNTEKNLQIFCNNAPDKWHVMGVNLSAGASYKWYRENLCRQLNYNRNDEKDFYKLLDGEVENSKPGSNGLLFLPYLNGERCPYSDASARGGFIGLGLHHNHSDMTRAVQEGIIFNLRHVYELIKNLDRELEVSEIRTSGGGSKSKVWRQIQADIFQLPVKTVHGSSEGGAYGAALIAGAGCGVWSSVEEAVKNLKIESVQQPNPKNEDIYNDFFNEYKKLYNKLKSTNENLVKIEENKYN